MFEGLSKIGPSVEVYGFKFPHGFQEDRSDGSEHQTNQCYLGADGSTWVYKNLWVERKEVEGVWPEEGWGN